MLAGMLRCLPIYGRRMICVHETVSKIDLRRLNAACRAVRRAGRRPYWPGFPRPYTPRWDDDLERWIVKGSSILLYGLLKRAKDDPWILMPYLEDYPAETCQGFFSAEGWVNVDCYQIVAGNTDPNITDLFKKLLEKLGINYRTY